MELKLTFKEKEIRKIYNEHFSSLEMDEKENLHWVNKLSIILILLTTFFLFLTFFHADWLYYGLFFLFILLIFRTLYFISFRRNSKKIRNDRLGVDKWLNRLRSIENIYYIYDDKKIEYYESDKLVSVNLWDDFIQIVKEKDSMYLFFKSPGQTIWIPYKCAEIEEIELFEQSANEKVKNVR